MRMVHVLALSGFFFLVSVVNGLFSPGNAYAWSCCTSCPCKPTCICPGVGSCPWFQCLTDDDSSTLPSQTLITDKVLNINGMYSTSESPAIRSYSIDRLIARVANTCDTTRSIQKVFRDPEDRLRFDLAFLKYDASDKNAVVAFQMRPDEER